MAIAKKPSARPVAPALAAEDQAASAFISGAGQSAPEPAAPARPRKARVMTQFDAALLRQVDAAAQKRGISRSAWIQFVISQALEEHKG